MCERVSTEVTDDATATDVATTVVSVVAAADGVDPVDLDACLADYVDPDALAGLFAPDRAGANLSVSFPFRDYEVVVESPGTVAVFRPCGAPGRCEVEA